MNKLWENPPYDNWDEYQALCLNSVPSDFYFHIMPDQEDGGFCIIALVPKAYFLKEHYMWDQSMPLDHILPSDFSESMESVWDSERSFEDIRKDLLTRGFEENKKFSQLVCEDFGDGY